MGTPFRVIVLGEGKDESGNKRTLPPFTAVPHEQQGAMEILVRRALYPLLNNGQPWHKGLKHSDGIQILQPPAPRRLISMVEAITHDKELALFVAGALRPEGGRTAPRADLLVVTHDADVGAELASKAVLTVNRNFNTHVPLVCPNPEIQAWLARKRSIEQAYDRPFCSVPEPDEQALKSDAKKELRRLLATFGGKFDTRKQARMAEFLSSEELAQYEWAGWSKVPAQLEAAIQEEKAYQAQRMLGAMKE